ncbi:protein-glutamate O-methyltransferase CheR [Limnohabitans sp. Jir72]|uniref:CheR family methyltransferase n=1 Tax=Limnohabitans sp. Jir72 TaxID=1977909 RepID=UPI000D3C7946|nr:protein-glutamate O-methyltransferase CheR [Limnohabitans sp. Jir72]PUE36082.1 hypothetical protein B9Z52_02775 [Limnohabitans sp. Jir72]
MKYVYPFIRQYLHSQAGILLGPEKDYLIESRLHGLLKKHSLKDLEQLVCVLESTPEGDIAAGVISSLTTHETSWFRDQRPFDRLRTEVLPQLRQQQRRQISVWSAACSTGQEIYSIAMLLRDEGMYSPMWQVSLYASDICKTALAQAERGVYNHFEIERGLAQTHRQRYFEMTPAGWRISSAVRQSVRFEAVNLTRLPDSPERFDIIFCRNVLIYFDPNTQRKVLQNLHDKLVPGGFLFLGAAESTAGLCDGFQYVGTGSGLYVRSKSLG